MGQCCSAPQRDHAGAGSAVLRNRHALLSQVPPMSKFGDGAAQPGAPHDPTGDVELSIRCNNLKSMDWMSKSVSLLLPPLSSCRAPSGAVFATCSVIP